MLYQQKKVSKSFTLYNISPFCLQINFLIDGIPIRDDTRIELKGSLKEFSKVVPFTVWGANINLNNVVDNKVYNIKTEDKKKYIQFGKWLSYCQNKSLHGRLVFYYPDSYNITWCCSWC